MSSSFFGFFFCTSNHLIGALLNPVGPSCKCHVLQRVNSGRMWVKTWKASDDMRIFPPSNKHQESIREVTYELRTSGPCISIVYVLKKDEFPQYFPTSNCSKCCFVAKKKKL